MENTLKTIYGKLCLCSFYFFDFFRKNSWILFPHDIDKHLKKEYNSLEYYTIIIFAGVFACAREEICA